MTRRVQKAADQDTETFVPAVTFDGYPDGKTKVTFRAGVESIPVPKEFAQLMRDKGYVATGALHVASEILPDGEIHTVRKYRTDEPLVGISVQADGVEQDATLGDPGAPRAKKAFRS